MINMPTKKELMQRLNTLLGTEYCWSRLNKLDLQRLVIRLEKWPDHKKKELKFKIIDTNKK